MAEIFTRKFSEVSGGRFDPEFYIGQTIQIVTYPLKNFVKIKSGKRIPKGRSYANATTTYKYLRVDDLDSEILEIDIDKLKSIDKDIFTLLERYEIYNDEVALSIAGTIGKVFIFHNATNNRVILTENCVKLQAQDNLLPKFLSLILKTNFLQSQMKRQYIQTTIPKLAIERIKELQIPSIPPLSTQQHIIDLMDKAYKAKQEKENKAKELLDSIDSYLLEELGIILPLRANNTLDSRIYTQKISGLSGSRFDANYHQKYYTDLEKSLLSSPYPLVNLASLINNFEKGIEVGSNEYSQNKEIPFIRVSDITNNGIDFDNVQKFISASLFENLKAYKPKENELLYSKDGTVGICLEADTSCDYIISGGILRLELKAEVDKDFLCFLLGSYIMNVFANRVSIGAVIKHLNIGEFLNLKIPLPPLAIQTQIANRLKNSKFQALSLEKEAKEILHKAKIDVETLLLSAGGGGVTLAFSFEAFISTQMYYFDKMTKIWNEKEYSVVKLKAITQNIQTGTTPHKNLNPYLQNTKIQFIRNSDIHNGEIALDDIKFIDESLKDLLTYSYKNEVLVCIAGTIGVSAVNNIGQLAINQNISSLKFCDDEVSSSFVCYWLNSKLSLEFFHRNATIATISYINNQTLLNLKIPLPPLTEQERIAKEISQRKTQAKALKQEAKKLLESAKKEVEHIILGG
ncbi:restriction endonuclease subunit S [Campylobacter upsaliensis]|uniref:restriction endonuclease subunit S n=1 Tax=Campylobacter upsaliensis TaxID=28080 RepID=UPI0022EB3A8B|nr:restriction endonuclease subunit S [Campylobacter upsaliensis]MEB2801395.1 restriction endonuclease subunit S [Campylobacter upsaliensis]MEB2827275.1 restriction endonuclease subunit S [Campylobacter upsaliensis]